MAKYRILSLDGGGIRGVYSARLLARLEQAVPGFLKKVRLFAGTSTGGIVALGLAAGLAPGSLVKLYTDHGSDIFDDSWWDDVLDIGGLSGADYDNKKLQKVLTGVFGRKRLSDLGSKRVLIPAFDLDNSDDRNKEASDPRSWKAKFFHNYPGEGTDADEFIVDVALRTSAAPTYFPSYQGYIDGGVIANNPSVSAMAQALDADTGGQTLSDLRLLSIGTGENPTYLAGQSLDWGYAQWAKPLINLMIDGVMGVSDYECRRILRGNYHRVSSLLPRPMKLDDVKSIPDLLKAADAVDLSAAVAWLKGTY
jgi:uncharacterized protein